MTNNQTLTMSSAQVAVCLGISESHAYELARRDGLPAPVITLGRRRVVSKTEVTRLLDGVEATRATTTFSVSVHLDVPATPALLVALRG